MMIRLGVDALLIEGDGRLPTPPICTVTCALASRRSSDAFWISDRGFLVLAKGLNVDARNRPRARLPLPRLRRVIEACSLSS